jgi:photosystem II stability/assembly factor-like uncharacterized protein
MSRLRRFVPGLLLLIPAFLALPSGALSAQPFDQSLFSDLRWRSIGPFRSGWATCIEGIPDQPDTFYFGAVGGGVWKTDDAGRSWTSLFDHESAAAIGAIAIAPSDPKVIYVGTGHPEPRYDVISGDGVFRSGDGGRSWTKRGLQETRYIGRILVDPRDPNVVLVAALGHIFGPNRERGVFRSTDGGATWSQPLFVDENTGAVDLAADPKNPDVIYAAAWQFRNYPWLSYFKPNIGPGSAVYKSTDGGKIWKRLAGGGWPNAVVGRIGLAVSPGGRVWALVDAPAPVPSPADAGRAATPPAGLYRSDDAGAAWTQVNATPGLSTYYFGRVTPDPTNPDVVYVMGQSIRRSQDGGKTFTITKGAPGGDDYHHLWINPKHPERMATGADQGAIVTVNGGRTWSDWYNQPTGQFYHVETDDRFPYWVYSGQQDMGTVGTSSRGDSGGLTFREWHPVGADERGWDVPDPSDPEIVYGTGLGGSVIRFDGRTGQGTNISPIVESTYARKPTEVKHRYTWITPLAVSRKKPHAIYHASQVLFRSTNRGRSWTIVSPDLTGAVEGTSGCDGEITLANARPCGFGVIYAIALSPDENEIWVGTDSGLIQLTRDGGRSWQNVTPKNLPAWSKVAILDLSALEPGVVYAAIDSHRLDDFAPHLLKTRDFGKTWTAITTGLPPKQYTTVVRADPVRKGLLYAGTLGGVFVSFDEGAHWQPLQLNFPTAWVEDLQVHGNDLVAATNGRALWILDGLAPLRQLSSSVPGDKVHLFAPSPAIRVRRNINHDTPLPPETPMGKNPPTGAILDYVVPRDASGPLTIEILDSRGDVVRKYSSEDKPESLTARRYFADDWVKPAPPPSAAAGHHRFVWDLRGPRPRAESYDYSIAAIWGEDTPIEPEGPLVVPGSYTVRLTAGGTTVTQALTVEPDPRASASRADYVQQYELATRTATEMERTADALAQVRARRKKADAPDAKQLESAEKVLGRLSARLSGLFSTIESGDAAPSVQAVAELADIHAALEKVVGSTPNQ